MREQNASLKDRKWGHGQQEEEVAWDWQRMLGVV